MSSLTEPVMNQGRYGENDLTVKEWLDALSGGACDEAQFLGGVEETLRSLPDSGWELLGLVDQYYRRGKLSAQTFGLVKTHLQGLMVGKMTSEEISVPPRMQGEPASGPPPPLPPRSPSPSPTSVPAAAPMPSAPSRPSSPSSPSAVSAPAAAASGPAPLHTVVRPPMAPAERAPEAAHSPRAPGALPGAPSIGDPSPRPLVAGDVLRGRYVVQGMVGQGAMGTVYAAIDQFRLDRDHGEQQVALKVLHTEVIKRPRLFAELRREFQHLQTLSHPNIVRVHEFDRDGDLAFFTMEYLSGTLLSRVLSGPEVPLYRPYALAIIRDVGAAISHAHARGVVHGDLNPANIFVTDQGEVRVLDFGASHPLRRDPWISEFENHRQIKVATPGYASCQVLEGETAEARDDVFSLACVAYLLLAGDRPFRDNTALKARTAGMSPPRPPGLTPRQWNVLRVGLSFDRDRRPADVQDWLRRLDLKGAAPHLPPLLALRAARPYRPGGRVWTAAAAMLVMGLAAGAWQSMQRADSRALAKNAINAAVTWTVDHASTGKQWASGLLSSARTPLAGEAPAVNSEVTPPVSPPVNPTANPTANPAINAVVKSPVNEPAPKAARPATQPPAPAAAVSATPPKSQAPRAEPSSPPAVTAAAVTAADVTAAGLGGAGAAARAHIDLAADSIELAPSDPIAHIVVHRTRNLRDDVSFNWWTEPGTAKPNRDFVPVKPQVEHIDSGQGAVSLIIPVVVDPSRRESRNFYVVIDQPSDNATLGSHTLTMVTVPGSE